MISSPLVGGTLAAGVRDDDDLELEPLRGVDGQQPHRARPLLLRDRLELAHAGRVLLEHEADEALDVGAAQLLVRAREPRQLAQVRVAAAAVPLGEDGEVVVVLDDDLLAEPLEPDGAGDRGQAVVALAEGLEQPRVALGEAFRQAPSRARRRAAAAARRGGAGRVRRSRRRRTAKREP